MSGYTKHLSETKYMSFLIKNDELLEKQKKKSGIKSAIILKMDLIVNQYTMNFILKLK